MVSLILSTQLPPVQGGGGGSEGGGLGQGSERIDVEIAIVGMLLAKVVAGLRLGLTSGENLLQLMDELLQFLAGKFLAEPKHEAWYVAHGGESLGNLAGSLKRMLERETSPPFLLAVNSHRRSSSPIADRPPDLPNGHWLTAPQGEKAEIPASSTNSTE